MEYLSCVPCLCMIPPLFSLLCFLAYSPKQSEAMQHSHSTNASYILVIGHLYMFTSVNVSKIRGTGRPAFAASGQLPALCLNRFDPPADFQGQSPEPIGPWQFQLQTHGIEPFFSTQSLAFHFVFHVCQLQIPWNKMEQAQNMPFPHFPCIPNAGNRFTLVSACLVAISALLVTSSSASDKRNEQHVSVTKLSSSSTCFFQQTVANNGKYMKIQCI